MMMMVKRCYMQPFFFKKNFIMPFNNFIHFHTHNSNNNTLTRMKKICLNYHFNKNYHQKHNEKQRCWRWKFPSLCLLGSSVLIGYNTMHDPDSFIWDIATQITLKIIPPEPAHHLVMLMAKYNILPRDTKYDSPRLASKLCGIPLSNPIGLAAGFDKSCENPLAFIQMGYGLVEIGTVTPLPQEGNPLPRLFRLPKDKAIINRYGFNNVGVQLFTERLKILSKMRWKKSYYRQGAIGVNIGINKTTTNPLEDYKNVAQCIAPYADYVVINVSSPNTPGLRLLQQKESLTQVIKVVQNTLKNSKSTIEVNNNSLFSTITGQKPPLFIKISPDVTYRQLEDISTVIKECNIDGVIVSNTTISRPSSMKTSKGSYLAEQAGGLSGPPLRELSTQCIRKVYELTQGRVPIIASGGISCAADALEKIESGASAIQIYTAMIYSGPGICRRIKDDLTILLREKGYSTVESAIGAWHIKTPLMSRSPFSSN